MRLVNIALYAVATLIALIALIVAAGVAIYLNGAPLVAWLIEHPLSTAMGRTLRIGGTTTVTWGSPTRITLDDFHVANADWGSEPDMFTAKHAEIDLYLSTLIFGPTDIPLVTLDGTKLLLETSKDGAGNWKLGPVVPKHRDQFPDLAKLTIRHGEFDWHNGDTEARTQVKIDTADYSAPDATQPITIAVAGQFQRLPTKFTLNGGPLPLLRDTTRPYPVRLDGKIGQETIAFDGTIGEPLDFAGIDARLSLQGPKLTELTEALGVPMPELPDFKGTSKLTGGNGTWNLGAMTVALGASDLEGGLDIDTTGRVPYVRANLTSAKIDLADFTGLYGAEPERSTAAPTPQERKDEASGRILPDTKIEVGKLPDLNADLSFDGKRVISETGLPLEGVTLVLQLKDGQLHLKPLRFRLANGDVDLNFDFTPFTKATPPHLVGRIDVRHLDLHQLLSTNASPLIRKTGGIAGGVVKIDTTGDSTREFLGRMNGEVSLFLEHGHLSELLEEEAPINVIGILGVYARGDSASPINCAISRFDVKQGVATPSTLLMDTEDTTVTGEGTVNFTNETLNLTLTPKNKKFATVSLRTPVDVGGTFAHPTFGIQPMGLVGRLGASVGLGIIFPPAALLALVDTGLGDDNNACAAAYAKKQ